MKVNITGLDKAEVLRALYNYALFSGPNYELNNPMSVLVRTRSLSSRQSAIIVLMEAAHRDNYYFDSIDLGQGLRPLHIDLSGDEIDVTQYDLHHGAFSDYAFKVIQQTRIYLARHGFMNMPNTYGSILETELAKASFS